MKIGVLFGGRSGEHEVSLASATTVMDALAQAGYQTVPIGISPEGRWLTSGDPLARLTSGEDPPAASRDGATQPTGITPFVPLDERMPAVDVIFPVLHGPFGEDGTVQGLLEMAGLPYVGDGVLASAVGMDKITSKTIFGAEGIPQVKYRALIRREWLQRPREILDEIERDFVYPLFAKPANLGSSVGVSKVRNRQELAEALELACAYDRRVLVEAGVEGAREIEVSVLGNDEPIASIPGEIVPGNEFYDYEAKYQDGRSQLLIPAVLEAEQAAAVCSLALQAFRALDCAGLARVDFLLGQDGTLYLNELNTMPGFTRHSMYPKLWEASGIPLPELVRRLVELALERHADRQRNRISRGCSENRTRMETERTDSHGAVLSLSKG
ncbi:MAG: D-alanine--D-alanine ligase [Caldilineaceae bacterium]|nr:D-alanine--D-alanine ligase [Caldilineaceae bacterium]HRJ40377.1 D-alanine--D-alanine ligase family protein [Caldilineaceae bacterium]